MARANFAVRAPANGGRWSEYVAHGGEHACPSMPGVFASVGAVLTRPRCARRGQRRPSHVASSPCRLRSLRSSVCESVDSVISTCLVSSRPLCLKSEVPRFRRFDSRAGGILSDGEQPDRRIIFCDVHQPQFSAPQRRGAPALRDPRGASADHRLPQPSPAEGHRGESQVRQPLRDLARGRSLQVAGDAGERDRGAVLHWRRGSVREVPRVGIDSSALSAQSAVSLDASRAVAVFRNRRSSQ